MKTRSGFVSNSSSSSFVIIAEKAEFDKALKKIHKFYVAFLKQYMGYNSEHEKTTLMGKEVVVFDGVAASEDTPEIGGFSKVKSLPEELQEDAYEDDDYLQYNAGMVISLLVEALKKEKVDLIYRSREC